MTQQVRINFLNWRPDQEPLNNDGMTEADNCIHDTEGYKPIRVQTEGAFETAGPLGTLDLGNMKALQVRPVGIGGDLIYCGVSDPGGGGTLISTQVGFVGQATVLSSLALTGPLLSANAVRIKSFSVAEMENFIGVTAVISAEAAGGTATAVAHSFVVSYTYD